MIRIIKNNYKPEYVTKSKIVEHHGYLVTCDRCKSELFLEKEDISGCRANESGYFCPCCRTNRYFGRYKKHTLTETVEYKEVINY